jgi:predicted nucleotidyltransferase
MNSDATTLITDRLNELEQQHGFRILYACESGSRAWGFASADSDYDVRFLFVWPRDHYLSVFSPREDVDLAIDENELDLSGWELRKSLRLLRKSNGPLIEWLHSPIVYRDSEATEELRTLADEIFCPRSCAAHYLGLSRKMILALEGKPEAVTAKRYLYALRSLLAGGHVLRVGKPAPVAFAELLEAADLSRELRDEIDAMIAAKSGGKEIDAIGAQSKLNEYLKNEHQSFSAVLDQMSDMVEVDCCALDQIFRELIKT